MLIVLFFQCMAALLNPTNRRGEDIRWGVVFYTALMFSFATILTAVNLDIQSISFIDNREFTDGGRPLGPVGYQESIRPTPLGLIPNVMFLLNYWFADGLLVGPVSNVAFARPQV